MYLFGISLRRDNLRATADKYIDRRQALENFFYASIVDKNAQGGAHRDFTCKLPRMCTWRIAPRSGHNHDAQSYLVRWAIGDSLFSFNWFSLAGPAKIAVWVPRCASIPINSKKGLRERAGGWKETGEGERKRERGREGERRREGRDRVREEKRKGEREREREKVKEEEKGGKREADRVNKKGKEKEKRGGKGKEEEKEREEKRGRERKRGREEVISLS